MYRDWGCRIIAERNTWRNLRWPFGGKDRSTKCITLRVLLAHHEERWEGIHKVLGSMLEDYKCTETTYGEVDGHKWSLAICAMGVDLIGLFLIERGEVKYTAVAVDYFTKWVEVETLSFIKEAKTTEFIWKSIICMYGIPKPSSPTTTSSLIVQNFWSFCKTLGIDHWFSFLAHPKANGRVIMVNKIIKYWLKAKLEGRKGVWAEKLPQVL